MNNNDILDPLKQRLCLSAYTWFIIDQDRMSFAHDGNAISRAGLLNRIFLNFYQRAEASIPLRLEERRRELDSTFQDLPQPVRSDVANRLIKASRDELLAKLIQRCKNGSPDMAWNMTIQKEMGRLVTELRKRRFFTFEENAEITRGKFMAAVFEEYARNPYVEREKTYFGTLWSEIEDAINQERTLIISYAQKDSPLFVIPYSLEPDKLSMYNYLVGYAGPLESPKEALSLSSFRLAKITRVEIDRRGKPGSGKLSADQRLKIKEGRAKHGAMFISGEEKTVKVIVRLTPAGLAKYNDQVHMRPPRRDNKDNVLKNNEYVFECSERQAEYYFFKFGEDAIVLKPESLAKRFATMYKKAAEVYRA